MFMHISMYGILISVGFLVAYCISLFFSRRNGFGEHIDRMLFWALLPAVVFARIFFVLYHPEYFLRYPEEVVALWHGGWVWHGALLGGLMGIWLYCKKNSVSFFALLDLLAPGVALGQAIGRWGNFFNQEAYGLPTNMPWGIAIDPIHRLPGFERFAVFHPTFLYESILDLGLFLFLWLVTVKIIKKPAYQAGTIFFLYLLFYSLGRFYIEFLRIDLVPILAGLRAPQWLSLALIGISAGWFLLKRKKLVYLSS